MGGRVSLEVKRRAAAVIIRCGCEAPPAGDDCCPPRRPRASAKAKELLLVGCARVCVLCSATVWRSKPGRRSCPDHMLIRALQHSHRPRNMGGKALVLTCLSTQTCSYCQRCPYSSGKVLFVGARGRRTGRRRVGNAQTSPRVRHRLATRKAPPRMPDFYSSHLPLP